MKNNTLKEFDFALMQHDKHMVELREFAFSLALEDLEIEFSQEFSQELTKCQK
jgi:hypothetical protein